MKKVIGWSLVGLFVLTIIIYFGASWFFADVLINSETQTPEVAQSRMAEVGIDASPYGEAEPVTFEQDGVTLSGSFFDNPVDGECAVVLLHGYTSTRAGAMQYAPFFWERGCDLMAYDARGHGVSDDALHTYGYHEKQDLVAAFEWLQAETGLSAENIGLVGVSYGAATSLQAAPLLPDAAFVMADSPYATLRDIVVYQGARQFGDWTRVLVPGTLLVAGLRGQFDASDVSAETAVADATMPIFLTHSLQDEFTPPENTEAIYANSNPDTTVMILTDWGAPHGRSILEDFDSYETFVDDFLATYVPDFGTSAE